MIVLYVVCKSVLALAHAILTLRASWIEQKFVKTSCKVQEELKLSDTRPGNAMGDARLSYARKQYELGRMVEKCDRIGNRYVKAQATVEAIGQKRKWLASFQGRVTPYLFGVADVIVAMLFMNHFDTDLMEVVSEATMYTNKM